MRNYSDSEIEQFFRGDPIVLDGLRRTYPSIYEMVERRALVLGLIMQLHAGDPPAKPRAVTWQDPEFRGF